MNAECTDLSRLLRNYGEDVDSSTGQQFDRAFERYLKDNRESLFDILLTATYSGLSLQAIQSNMDPLLAEAIQTTSPSIAIEEFSLLSEASQLATLNAAKGKYFEMLVADRLNAGEQVGDVVLPDGYEAVLASNLNQPGWDLAIVGPDDAVVEYLQLKATDSASYVASALEQYPDIEILATSEVADSGLVLDAGITDAELEASILQQLDATSPDTIDAFLDYFSPVVPLVAIAAYEGYRLSIGQQSVDDFQVGLLRRGQRIMATSIAGGLVYALGGGLLALPGAIVAGVLFDRYLNEEKITSLVRASSSRMDAFYLVQNKRLSEGY